MKNTTFTTPLDVVVLSKTLGLSLKTARKRRGLTQEDAALRIGVAREVILNAEKGKPTSSHNLLAMFWLYGMLQRVVDVASPDNDKVGMSLETSRLPERVRKKIIKDDEF